MPVDDPSDIIKRIQSGNWNESDLEYLRQLLQSHDNDTLQQLGKFNISIDEGKDIHIGDRNYFNWSDEAIQAVVEVVQQGKGVAVFNPTGKVTIYNYNNNFGEEQSAPELTPEEQKQVVCDFLTEVEANFKHIKLFHTKQPIVLTDQYIPIQVTIERRYRKLTESIGSYAESEAELRQVYALKGSDGQLPESKEEIKRTVVDWEKARKEHEKIMVLADPGMGKSTLLKMEALTTAQQERQKL
ncbi:MAG: hypothetical protein F6K26_33955 [Moorea sp. SIO2I5]|nr:hypothetical protein [Moorena sp. SIO2I5]